MSASIMAGPVTGQSSLPPKPPPMKGTWMWKSVGLRANAADMLFLTRRPPCSLAQTSTPPFGRGTTTLTCGSMKQWLTRGNS